MILQAQLTKQKKTKTTLLAKIDELEETLRVIQSGEVDALVVKGPNGDRIFTLQSVEQPYRELVEAMNEGALTVDSNGTILYCNAKFEAMTRVPHGKLVGSDFKMFIRTENRNVVQELLKKSKSIPSTAEVSLRITEQISLPVQLSVSAIELIGTNGFCIIATDLSAQKQNTILFQQQEWLRTLLSLLPVPLVLMDSDLQGFSFINAKATEVLEGKLLVFENEQGGMIEICDLLMRIDSSKKSQGVETILVTRFRKISVLLFSETLPAMYGKKPTRLLMFQDISTIKQAQLDLSIALRGRDQFMAALSHELRTPINVILGWVQLLRSHHDDQAMVKQGLDTLDRNAELQRDLIENLLDMSRIITGSIVLQVKPIDLKIKVRDCITSLAPKAKEKEIELVVDIMQDTAMVLADDSRMQQLISNLVQNAIKFTPSNGKIIVSVRTDQIKGIVSVSVKDNGLGIDAEFLPYVFDPFKQENMSSSRTYGGLGIGLAICKTIVEQHQGDMTAASEGIGKGALFVVTLPLATPIKRLEPPILVVPEVTDLTGIRILLVDDSLDNLELFSIFLEQSGAVIKTLESAAGVIDALETFKPNILLSDISMPFEDGYSLIKRVRTLPHDQGGDIPAAALTAHAREEDKELILSAGFDIHISKPVSCVDLVKAVKVLADKVLVEKSTHS